MASKTLTASGVGQFAFCRRAWWYAQQGEPSINREQTQAGEEWHHRHGRDVLVAGCLRLAGYTCLLGAVVVAAAYLTTLVLR